MKLSNWIMAIYIIAIFILMFCINIFVINYKKIKDNWNNNILDSEMKWNSSLHDGVYSSNVKGKSNTFNSNFGPINLNYKKHASQLSIPSSEGYDLILYSKIGMGDGQQANNPWLQEFPDPLTRVSWDNYVTVSRYDAEKIGLKNYNESTKKYFQSI